MVFSILFFTLPTFLLSLLSSVLAVPVSQDIDAGHKTTLSPRINHSGRGTYFYPGLGNCGGWSDSSDAIVAISIQIYGDGGNCGQWVYITNTENGQSAYAQVVDSCQACGPDSLDMSPSVFSELADLSQGDIPITWHFMNREWSPS